MPLQSWKIESVYKTLLANPVTIVVAVLCDIIYDITYTRESFDVEQVDSKQTNILY